MDIPKYLGNECAELYWELWKNRRNYISRRVDIHELLDSQATRQSITFDINGREIQELYSARFDTQSVESLELHSFPLVLLNKRSSHFLMLVFVGPAVRCISVDE